MRRLVSALATTVLAAGLVVTVASPSHAETDPNCGQNDWFREPLTTSWVHWRKGKTFTRIEPHTVGYHGRAVVARYLSGVRYYYGPFVYNGTNNTTRNKSYVSSSVGVFVGNYYQSRLGSSINTYHHSLFDDYPRFNCAL